MISEPIEIINKLGLHARAAAKLVAVATQYASSITITKDGRTSDAKSIMAVMMLAAAKGSIVTVTVDGADEIKALDGVKALINNRFDEAE